MAFTNTYEMFSADFTKVLNALSVIHDKLVSTRNTYQTTEDTNTAQVNKVAGLIGGGGGAVKGGAGSGMSAGAGTAGTGAGTGMSLASAIGKAAKA